MCFEFPGKMCLAPVDRFGNLLHGNRFTQMCIHIPDGLGNAVIFRCLRLGLREQQQA